MASVEMIGMIFSEHFSRVRQQAFHTRPPILAANHPTGEETSRGKMSDSVNGRVEAHVQTGLTLSSLFLCLLGEGMDGLGPRDPYTL